MSDNDPSTNDDNHDVNLYNPAFTDSSTQTVIRVYPFILEDYTNIADIKSDKKIQTLLSVTPDLENSIFYSLLRYTPFQDIKEDSLRVLDIPRPRRLQFLSFAQHENLVESARMFSLEDDDGVAYICNEVLHRLEQRVTTFYVDAETQTEVKVSPHLLDPQSVAKVTTDSSSQTKMGCRRLSL